MTATVIGAFPGAIAGIIIGVMSAMHPRSLQWWVAAMVVLLGACVFGVVLWDETREK